MSWRHRITARKRGRLARGGCDEPKGQGAGQRAVQGGPARGAAPKQQEVHAGIL